MEEKQAAGAGFFTVANGLTFSRLVLLPVAIYGIGRHHGYIAVIAVALTLVTDLLDGRLARRFGGATDFGKTLDSTVDFVFIYSLFIALYAAAEIMTNQFVVIYLGMLTILTLQLVGAATGEEEAVVKTSAGKVTGALQFLYLLWLVLALVLPDTTAVFNIGTGLFVLVAVAIGFNSIECVQKLQKIV